MITKNKDSYIINKELCQQCGACIAVCNKKAIDYSLNKATGLMDLNISHEKCVKCGLCERICPANKDTSMSDVISYCKNKEYYLGHNSSDNIRKKASSGGVARTIIVEGLKNEVFDCVYTLKKISEYPFAEGFLYTKNNIPEYDEIPNSVYHSVPLNINMNRINRCDKILLVGTSCQLSALKEYLKNRCNNIYTLCIFCKQQKTFESTKFIAKLAGVKLNNFNDLKSFSYRGNGWPGYCSFNKKDIPWGVAAIMPFGRKLWIVPGCNICGNPFGTNADITVLDPWCIESKNDLGNSLIITHSEKGNELLELPNLEINKTTFEEIEPALMFDDIIKKNSLISYFKGEKVNETQRKKGKAVEKQRKRLQWLITSLPKMPLVFYKIINKLIKDKR